MGRTERSRANTIRCAVSVACRGHSLACNYALVRSLCEAACLIVRCQHGASHVFLLCPRRGLGEGRAV